MSRKRGNRRNRSRDLDDLPVDTKPTVVPATEEQLDKEILDLMKELDSISPEGDAEAAYLPDDERMAQHAESLLGELESLFEDENAVKAEGTRKKGAEPEPTILEPEELMAIMSTVRGSDGAPVDYDAGLDEIQAEAEAAGSPAEEEISEPEEGGSAPDGGDGSTPSGVSLSNADRGMASGLPERKGMTNGLAGMTNGLVNGSGRGRTNGMTNGLPGRTNGLVNGAGRGRTNGWTNGMTNGRGRTNGMVNGSGRGRTNGVTNGRTNGMTNGVTNGRTNGLTNGTVPFRRQSERERRRKRAARNRLATQIALAIVMILMLPVIFVLIVPAPAPAKIVEVDGDFGDWSGKMIYADQSSFSIGTLDVEEFSLASEDDTLYGYIRTREPSLVGSQPERFFVFVDADKDEGTGYFVDGIGAEYVVEAYGYDGSPNVESKAYSGGDPLNWSALGQVASGKAAVGSGRIEFGVSLGASVKAGGYKARVASMSADSLGELCAPIVDGKGGALVVRQTPLDANGLLSGANLMTIRLAAVGGDVTVDSVDFDAVGVTPTISGFTPGSVVANGESMEFTVASPLAAPGTLVKLAVSQVGCSGSHSVVGTPLSAYATSPPAHIVIDGAFGDWNSVSKTSDLPLGDSRNPSLDILRYAGQSTPTSLFAFVELASAARSMEGTVSPVARVRSAPPQPYNGTSNGSANGTEEPTPIVYVPRLSGEDSTLIYIDSVPGGQLAGTIYADYYIEIKGYAGKITSRTLRHIGGSPAPGTVQAEAGGLCVEAGVALSAVGGTSGAVSIYIETTDWKGTVDSTNQIYTVESRRGSENVTNQGVGEPEEWPTDTSETGLSRVTPASDGTRADTGASSPNGIAYMWQQSQAFSLSHTVATFGTNSKGISVDSVGTWNYNIAYTQCSADMGSVFDDWTNSEDVIMVYEVFNDQSTTGRNYTMIFEDEIEGDTSTNFGNYNSQNRLTPINNPTLSYVDGGRSVCVITITQQTTGYETASLWDGYRVFKSVNPITQSNQGTALGDATWDGSNWVYTDTSFTADAYYAVKVKWDGSSTGSFYAPLYSYGMSNDTFVDYISAVATGPTSAGTSVANPTITYSYSGTPSAVDIYYTSDGGTTWIYWGTDSSVDGSWSPSTNIPASGTYHWNAKANHSTTSYSEPVPSGASSIEAGPYVLSLTVPEFPPVVPVLFALAFVLMARWSRKRREPAR